MGSQKKRTLLLQQIISKTPFKLSDTTDTPVMITASFGISSVAENDLIADAALIRADTALYEAKNNGRNQVILFNADRKPVLVADKTTA